ncbi:hypothetical protein J5N97_009326 [Dioscorea zingiberensis]|uniref:CCAAT-binding factor domain-containing protein n=1 Tax=Dioscorea zingiberensis TaxID=325984 RepID=A0A9D5CWZ3_9LILI|nr:hypothetical protein J5N97_009326 [Dioscorea zingiberensis]
MAVSKPKKPQRIPEDVDLLKSDVASFASSLGLAAGAGTFSSSTGFDDSDFRKSGPIKPRLKGKISESTDHSQKAEKNGAVPRPKAKPHPLDLDPFASSEKKKDTPKLPLMKAGLLSGQWYVDADELEIKVLGEEGRRKVPALGIEGLKVLAAKKKEIAEMLMEQYAKDYDVSRRKKGDLRLLEMTARSGTSADKVSAFTCLVEDNPIANIRSLDALLSMVTSKVGKRYAFTGFEALRELFLLRLLPDRKLKSLLQHPLDALPETKDGFSLLLFWYWEECLKQRYERFVIALEEALKDMLPNLKDKAMKTVYILLKSKPEQERRLLAALVNKVHAENFNVGVQALMLLYQISSKNQIVSDRFYRALYSKLLTPASLNSSKPEMFLGLLFKAMKNDVNLKRVSAFSKRFCCRFPLQRPAQYACGCSILLSEQLIFLALSWPRGALSKSMNVPLINCSLQLDMNHHLIGDEILQLAEEDVPPEDVVFHRFYMNKTNSSKRPKVKKKKASEDEDAEDLLADVDNESEEEEIDDMLGHGKTSCGMKLKDMIMMTLMK